MSDTTPRDALALAFWLHTGQGGVIRAVLDELADMVVEWGWRPPARVIQRHAELGELPEGTVIMEGDHGTPDDTGWGFKTMPGVFHRFPDGWHVVAGIGEHAPDLPATVLWEPEEGE